MDDDELGARVGTILRELFPQPTDAALAPRMHPRRNLRAWAIATTVVGVLTLAAVVVLLSVTHGPGSSPTVTNPAAPQCAEPPPSVGSTVSITLSNTPAEFDSNCYYALADAPISLQFTNNILATESGQGVPRRLVISPADKPSITWDSAHPGFFGGTTKSAVFSSESLTAPASATYTVGPLAAGTYVVQTIGANPDVASELIVTAP
jgi:hypothetical protein